MLIFGADPGKTGGIVAIEADGGWINNYWPMSQFCDAIEESILERKKQNKILWVVEKAQAMPKNGAVSMFTYGTGYGKLLGALEVTRSFYKLVSPRTWTKELFQGQIAVLEGKLRNIKACKLLAPEFCEAITKRTKPDMGLVDAYLIAEYGRRHLLDQNY